MLTLLKLELEKLLRSKSCYRSFLRIDADAERLAAANALLVGNGIKVYELSPAQESLEEAFLRLTKTVDSTGGRNE